MNGDGFFPTGAMRSGGEDERPTADNPHLSEPKIVTKSSETHDILETEHCHLRAINCTPSLSPEVESYIEAGIAPATRRAYRSDLDHFRAWGGDIPATDAQLAAYLAAHAMILKPATLARRLAAISVAHEASGFSSPARSPLIRAILRGVRREHGSAQRQAKALLRDDLFAILDAMGDGLKDKRDRALLLLGFAGAFRRSELCAIDCTDIEGVRQGIVITLRRSKTDQAGEGRRIGIPYARGRWCPVSALDRWRLWHAAALYRRG